MPARAWWEKEPEINLEGWEEVSASGDFGVGSLPSAESNTLVSPSESNTLVESLESPSFDASSPDALLSALPSKLGDAETHLIYTSRAIGDYLWLASMDAQHYGDVLSSGRTTIHGLMGKTLKSMLEIDRMMELVRKGYNHFGEEAGDLGGRIELIENCITDLSEQWIQLAVLWDSVVAAGPRLFQDFLTHGEAVDIAARLHRGIGISISDCTHVRGPNDEFD
ncbi:hypothetical protein N656DRAFT_799720 [Canariomyces notabilis]|uniref:Uncharacterized protein n=1 Tax=Canariomyces notabilis TaxID=2074819 RepID=A0AAN6TB35_9PEZI|nr:hypothetical protein N656DRAFT_799720 [Canariomyces arenarius]